MANRKTQNAKCKMQDVGWGVCPNKLNLEELVQKYETKDFVKDDPIQFPHRFMSQRYCEGVNVLTFAKGRSRHCETLISGSDNQYPPKQSISHIQDIEIAAFLASIFSYGNRKVFVKKLDELFKIMGNKPHEFVIKGDFKKLKSFNYRFAKDYDVIEVFNILRKLYSKGETLKALFEHGWNLEKSIQVMIQSVTDYFYLNVENNVGQGFYHLIPNPKNGGAVKRMNMFLRWMVRKGPVDLGVWNFIPASELLIPLDVHVARQSRKRGLLTRKSNDFLAVLELSENLKKLDAQDPVKFDFAMFGLGINEQN